MVESIKKIVKKNEEIISYLVVGGLTTLVSLIVYYLCVNTFLKPDNAIQLQVANILSWVISVSFAYIANRIFVFKSKSNKIIKEIISFVSARIITLLLDMFTMFLMVTLLHINDSFSKIVSQVLVIVLNYIFSKLFVFKK